MYHYVLISVLVFLLGQLFISGHLWVDEKSDIIKPNQTSNSIMIAVAANFREPIREIARQFEKDMSYQVKLVFGSSGQLFSQITHGAPYDLFLSADQIKPKLLAEKGLAVAKSQHTYAIGQLALWANERVLTNETGELLKPIEWKKVAIANPKFAPYGLAAESAIAHLKKPNKPFDVNEQLNSNIETITNKETKTKKQTNISKQINAKEQVSTEAFQIVQGKSIAQAYQFVKSGNADHGLVALSLVINEPKNTYWIIPSELHEPIKQDMIRLNSAKDNPIVTHFMAYLLGSRASRDILFRYGYQKSNS